MKIKARISATAQKADFHEKARGPRSFYRSSISCFLLLVLAAFSLQLKTQTAAPTAQAVSADSHSTPADLRSGAPDLSSYEGQNVSQVEIAGRPDLAPDAYVGDLAQKVNQPFANEKVQQSADTLKHALQADNIRILVEPQSTGIRVAFVLEPAFYFGVFQFPGAERYTYSRLIQVANYPTQTPFSAHEVEQDRQALVKFFRQQGYFQATVNAVTKIDDKNKLTNIEFQTELGKRAKFGELKIDDGTPQQEAAFKHSLQTLLARARGSAIRSGRPYFASTLTRATQYLQSELEKKGLLSGKAVLSGAEYHAETNRADIHFTVNSGPKTDVEIKGARVWSWTKKSLLPFYQGVGVDDESVEEGRNALLSYFQDKGYFDVKVTAQSQTENQKNTVLYQIAKDSKHKVRDISVTGNKTISTDDLSSHLAVKKGHFLSAGDFSDKLVQSSVKNLVAVYASEGFSSATVVPKVDRSGGDVHISFRVIEGPRDIVHSIKVLGADTFPSSEYAPHGLKLTVGQPYSAVRAKQDRAEIISHYLQAGYLNSSCRETATEVSKTDSHEIDVVYHIFEGPKVNAGEILTLGREHTQQRLINEDTADLKSGEPLTESKLLVAGSQLYDQPGVFDWAEVDLKREITTQTNEDVLIKVHEAKRNDLTYGFGFELINRGGSIPSGTVALPNLPPIGLPTNFTTSQTTFYGPRGTIQYTRNNVRGKGDSISFTGFAGRLDQRIAAYYIDPQFRWTKWKATTSISGERNEENPIFSAQQELASTQFQRSIDAAKKNILFLRYSFSKTDLTRVEIPELVLEADRHVRLSTLAANLTRDTRDNAMDEHKGVLDSVELDFNTSKLGSNVDFVKLNTQAAFYKQDRHKIVWANSLRIGLAQPFASSRVPVSEAFFTGGGNSLRGFPLDGAGPQRAVDITGGGCNPKCTIQVPSGGNELLLINSEARIPLPIKQGLSIVPFYDGGNVFPNVGFHDFTSLYSNNVGVGLRYATPVGPVRFDIGHNLNPVSGVTSTNYFISIGQAF